MSLGVLLQATDWITIVAADGVRSVRRTGAEWLALADRFCPPLTTVQIKLSPRERDVAALIAKGMSNPEIARALFVREETIKDHVGNILKKTKLQNRIQVAVWWATTQEPLLKEQTAAGEV